MTKPTLQREKVIEERLDSILNKTLLIDDDLEYGNSIKENLSGAGIITTVVSSLSEAEIELTHNEYPVVLCDNGFEGVSAEEGAIFIREKSELFGGSQVVLVTAWALNQIAGLQDLKERGVIVVEKKQGHVNEIKSICRKVIKGKRDEVNVKFGRCISAILKEVNNESDIDKLIPGSYILQKMTSYLVGYIQKIPNRNLEQFYIDGRMFSPADILNEINTGSELSRSMIDMLLDDLLEDGDDD